MGANVLSLWRKTSTNGKMLVLVAGIRQKLSHSGFLPYDKLSLWAEAAGVSVSQPGKQDLTGGCHLTGLHYRQLKNGPKLMEPAYTEIFLFRRGDFATTRQQFVSLRVLFLCRLGKSTTVSRI